MQELLAERFHASPKLLQRLNPDARFDRGEVILVPNVEAFRAPSLQASTPSSDAAPTSGTPAKKMDATRADQAKPTSAPGASANVVTVTDKTKTLIVENANGEVVFYAPVTVGNKNDPLPVGEWKVNGVSIEPPFNYNPDLIWDADPSHAKAKIPPGPNSPVGVVWIDLGKEHCGIHGTPEPSRASAIRSRMAAFVDQLGRHAPGGACCAGHQGRSAMRRRRRRIFDEVLAPWLTVGVILGCWWLGASLIGSDVVAPSRPDRPSPNQHGQRRHHERDRPTRPMRSPGRTIAIRSRCRFRRIEPRRRLTNSPRRCRLPQEATSRRCAPRGCSCPSQGSRRNHCDRRSKIHAAAVGVTSHGYPGRAGTAVRAAVDGRIVKLFTSAAGGLTIYH